MAVGIPSPMVQDVSAVRAGRDVPVDGEERNEG